MNALYVTDREAAGIDRLKQVLSALAGAPGLTVQLREKDASDRELLELARRCREWLGPDVPLFVNRRFDLALAAGADGVHLPAHGLPLRRVRSATPRGLRIGVSTHSAAEACGAIGDGADLVVLGPIFDTPSKRAYGAPLGVQALADLPAASEHASAVYVIGGVDEAALDALAPYRDRIAGVAAIRLFQDAADPRAVCDRIARR